MKTKKITKEEYIREFALDLRTRKRKAIYVRSDVHYLLERMARSIKESGHDITLSAFVTMVLIRHINAHDHLYDVLKKEAVKPPATPKGGKASDSKPVNKSENGPA